jgi:quercetin dioxygenase-like cupin family protein
VRVIKDHEKTSSYGGSFSGAVEFAMLREAPDASVPDVALVEFHDGATTHWHSHPGGQLLWSVGGTGMVGTEQDGAVQLAPGELVETPAGEIHWHGAAPGSDAQLLALTWGTTDWSDRPAPTAPATDDGGES